MTRWLSPDPLGGQISNPQSLNRYSYALNNPTTLTDPLGLKASYCGSLDGEPLLCTSSSASGGDLSDDWIDDITVVTGLMGWWLTNGGQYQQPPSWSFDAEAVEARPHRHLLAGRCRPCGRSRRVSTNAQPRMQTSIRSQAIWDGATAGQQTSSWETTRPLFPILLLGRTAQEAR